MERAIQEKIESINSFLSTADINTLHRVFVSLMDTIFGSGQSTSGIGILSLTELEHPATYRLAYNLLNTNGPLLELLLYQTPVDAKVLSYNWDPSLNQQSIFVLEKPIMMNAFEYFMVCFFNLPLHARTTSIPATTLNNSLYLNLFTEYLQFFLFINKSDKLLDYVSKTCPNVQHRSSSQFPVADQVGRSTSLDATFPHSIVFLKVVCDFLLSSYEYGANSDKSTLWYQSKVRCPSEFHVNLVRNFIKHYYRFIFGPCDIFVQTTNQQSVLQKLNQMKKSLYDSCLLAPGPSQMGTKVPLYLMDSSQSELVPHLRIMNRICFDFLYYCCQNWPYDLNFEVVNECWLTAIQPWRYQEISLTNAQSKFSASPSKSEIPENELLHRHEAITSQYSLYVVPLVHFLRRMSSMDLNVYQAAHMVFRVAKVLNQPGLKHVLVDVESLLAKELQTQGSISSSSFMRFSTLPFASHIQYNSTGIWGNEMLDLVQQLLDAISSSVYKINDSVENRKGLREEATSPWSKVVKSMGDFFMLDENGTADELSRLKKCCSILIDSDRMLRSFFNLPLKTYTLHPSIAGSSGTITSSTPGKNANQLNFICDTFDGFAPIGRNRSLNLSRNRSFSASPSRKFNRSIFMNDSNSMLPDHTVDENGDLILTPYGRLEVISGMKKKPIRFRGDPENLPRSSDEMAILFKIVRILSEFVDQRFGQEMNNLTKSPGFKGCFFRRIFLPDGFSTTFGRGSKQAHFGKAFQPRLRIRFLSSKVVWVRLFFLYLIFWALLGVKSVLLFLCLVAAVVLLVKVCLAFCDSITSDVVNVTPVNTSIAY